MTPRIRRWTCGILFASQTLTACTSWQVVQVSPRALVDSAHVRSMRVTEKGGVRTVLESPRVSGDSLTGTVPVASTSRVSSFLEASHRSYPAHQIHLAAAERVEVRKFNLGLTLLPVGVIALLAVIGSNIDYMKGWNPTFSK